MRQLLATFLLSIALFGGAAAYSELVANSRYLDHSAMVLRDWADSLPLMSKAERQDLFSQALARGQLYDDEIVRGQLVDGMVVNRTFSGYMTDQCDSLLFSSLRFVALHKLGLADRAEAAWGAIEKSQDSGHWRRHPRCDKSTSRDMIMGLMVALSQQPAHFETHTRDLFRHIVANNGYFSTGPVYVSYVTPGMAKLVALLAPASGIREDEIPAMIRDGYSTNEVQLLAIDPGYQAHLAAMTVWLELEIKARQTNSSERLRRDAWADGIDSLVSPFSDAGLHRQRHTWTTHYLVELDPGNLFFRYLRLKSSGAMRPAVAAKLLSELLAMPQFPRDRLPTNCDRRADYLWQRASREFAPRTFSCDQQFSGTDFLWMAALLVEDLMIEEATVTAH